MYTLESVHRGKLHKRFIHHNVDTYLIPFNLLCHSVSLISTVTGDQLHVLAKINAKFEFGSTFVAICFKWEHWQFYIYCMPLKPC